MSASNIYYCEALKLFRAWRFAHDFRGSPPMQAQLLLWSHITIQVRTVLSSPQEAMRPSFEFQMAR